jgi:hypothetical protein
MTFWTRTLKIFGLAPVRIELRGSRLVIGEIESIGATSATVRKADGTLVVVQFDEIVSVLEPVRR